MKRSPHSENSSMYRYSLLICNSHFMTNASISVTNRSRLLEFCDRISRLNFTLILISRASDATSPLTDFKVHSNECFFSGTPATKNFCSRQNEYNDANRGAGGGGAWKKMAYLPSKRLNLEPTQKPSRYSVCTAALALNAGQNNSQVRYLVWKKKSCLVVTMFFPGTRSYSPENRTKLLT